MEDSFFPGMQMKKQSCFFKGQREEIQKGDNVAQALL